MSASPSMELSVSLLTSVAVVLRYAGTAATARVAVLPHVITVISDLLDHALPSVWSLPRASEANLLSLLPRLVARGISVGVDPYYWKYQCGRGLVSAVKHDNLAMVDGEDGKPAVVGVAVESSRARYICSAMVGAAASTGQVKMLQYLLNHPRAGGHAHAGAFGSAVRGGHTDAIKWFHEQYGSAAMASSEDFVDAIVSGHTQVVKFLFDHPGHSFFSLANAIEIAAGNGDLELLQWLFSKPADIGFGGGIKPMDSAARGGHLHVVL